MTRETMTSFSQFELPPFLSSALARMNITTPTPVQAEAIGPACEGRDILATAQTGTGKTIAYLVPLLSHLHKNKAHKAIILTPTRELAVQVKDAVMQMSDHTCKSVLLIGGEPIFKQIRMLRSAANPRVIIGTPGRIIDHLQRKTLALTDVSFFVLDEVDRMLDMGFSAQLAEIHTYLKPGIQTLMFSATMPPAIRLLAQKYLKDPHSISVGSTTQPTANVKQDIVRTKEADKYACLVKEIEARDGSIIVFVKTKRGAEFLADKLKGGQHLAEAIHGDLRQQKRAHVIDRFRKRQHRIMVATDIAARGIDVPHVELVINYDLPQCPEDYVHRIGRTGRAGVQGFAVSFIAPADNKQWNNIQNFMNGQQYTSGRENQASDRRPSSFKDRDRGGFKKRPQQRSFEFDESRNTDRRSSGGDRPSYNNRSSSQSDEGRPWERRSDDRPATNSSRPSSSFDENRSRDRRGSSSDRPFRPSSSSQPDEGRSSSWEHRSSNSDRPSRPASSSSFDDNNRSQGRRSGDRANRPSFSNDGGYKPRRSPY
jgi:ATP-dependent RNA helicase DeaD